MPYVPLKRQFGSGTENIFEIGIVKLEPVVRADARTTFRISFSRYPSNEQSSGDNSAIPRDVRLSGQIRLTRPAHFAHRTVPFSGAEGFSVKEVLSSTPNAAVPSQALGTKTNSERSGVLHLGLSKSRDSELKVEDIPLKVNSALINAARPASPVQNAAVNSSAAASGRPPGLSVSHGELEIPGTHRGTFFTPSNINTDARVVLEAEILNRSSGLPKASKTPQHLFCCFPKLARRL